MGLKANDSFLIGPDAFDVAKDGKIAILDQVNKRILIFPSELQNPVAISLPIEGIGDVQLDKAGHILVLDYSGEQPSDSNIRVPQLYRVSSKGKVLNKTPVFGHTLLKLSNDNGVVDIADSKLVQPIDETGNNRSRSDQRKKVQQDLIVKYLSENNVRLANIKEGIVFDVHSDLPLGAIIEFTKTNDGYVVVFESADYHVFWFDKEGGIIQGLLAPNYQYTQLNPNGRIAINADGSVYIFGSTEQGAQINILNIQN